MSGASGLRPHRHTSAGQGGTISLDQVTAPAADVSLSSHKITDLAAPGSDNDAARKKYVDDATAGVTAGIPSTADILAIVGPRHAHIDNVTFSGDGATTVFVLPASPVDEFSVAVYVAGAREQDWVLSGALLDTLTFGSPPASAANNIVIDIVAVL